MNKNEIAVSTNYTALKDFNLAEALASEMSGMDITFDRISVPAAGGQAFEVPGEMPGETAMVKDFKGVILCHHPMFSYYRERFTGGNNPPDCGSCDGITGVGNPGGVCARCPLNVYGSGENGGKACKNKRRVYVLREGELIPVLLTLPTGSIKEFNVYIQQLLAKGNRSYSVVTNFSLTKATNAKGITYSKVLFTAVSKLSPEELPYVKAMSEQINQYASRVGYDNQGECVDPVTGEVYDPENPFA